MATKPLASPERLRQLLRYEPDTGYFFWVEPSSPRFNPALIGTRALSCSSGNGYLKGNFDGRLIFAHRAAIAYCHGKWPEKEVDHINGVPTDNRICNLREVSKRENQLNSKSRRTSTSTYKGVSWFEKRSGWIAQARTSKGNIYIGIFSEEIDAAKAYDAFAKENFGCYARLNFP